MITKIYIVQADAGLGNTWVDCVKTFHCDMALRLKEEQEKKYPFRRFRIIEEITFEKYEG